MFFVENYFVEYVLSQNSRLDTDLDMKLGLGLGKRCKYIPPECSRKKLSFSEKTRNILSPLSFVKGHTFSLLQNNHVVFLYNFSFYFY